MSAERGLLARVVEGEARRLLDKLSPSWVEAVAVSHQSNPAAWRQSLFMDVRFELVGVDMSSDLRITPDLQTRMRAALLVKEPSAKTLKVERRLLRARAAQARTLNKRPVVVK
ncbi:hypothetical protein [Bradyrhizobium sp. OK095]|uniref:hypothetical protein n=1 Tax=Bradyrhizobium sp. OK095 TaxID=1882760 RepID=UPI0008D687C5|nr:hypothetical protein [Bradyrhizobium sp. OK095]SEN67310.1 hypothetical protein SAMN05443254_11037 [Bradyrhizobium sp. OK095]